MYDLNMSMLNDQFNMYYAAAKKAYGSVFCLQSAVLTALPRHLRRRKKIERDSKSTPLSCFPTF